MAGQSVLLIETTDPALSVRLISEFEQFQTFKNEFVENGGRWAQTNFLDFEDNALSDGEIRLANAGISVADLISESPSDDLALENLLKGVLNALAYTHESYTQKGENRGHGNVRPELIFQDSSSADYPYLLGPALNRIPGPYQPELYPEKAFDKQIPTQKGDLYALGMIALRLRMGDQEFGEFYSEIYELEGDRDIAARWQGWHDNIFLHPKLNRKVGADDKLSNFVMRLLERNEDAQFPSARFALEELSEFTGAIKVKPEKTVVVETAEESAVEDEDDDPFVLEPKKKNTKLINGLLIGACAIVAASVAVVIFKPDVVTNVFGSGSGITLQAVDDTLSVDMADSQNTSCNVITGTGNCAFDDLTTKNKRNIEKLKQEMFVSAVTFGETTKREAPFRFSTDDGFSFEMSQNGSLTVNTENMAVNVDSRETNRTILYTLKVKNKTDEGAVNVVLTPPNTKPTATTDDVKIPVDKIEDFKSFSLLKNDIDPDLANKPSGWSFNEQLRIYSVNGIEFDGSPIDVSFDNGETKVKVRRDGLLEFENVPETVTEPISASFTYNAFDVLGARSGDTTANITITKPDWENSNPIAQPDSVVVDMITESLPVIFGLMADNGSGIDTDNDISEEMAAIGISDSLKVIDVNGQPVSAGGDISLSNGAKVQVIEDGTVAILEAPSNVEFGKPVSEQLIYTLADEHGGLANGVATLNFMMSADPNYEQLNDSWRIKVRGRVPNGSYQQVQSVDLPSINDCRSFARNITEEKAKRLLHPDYDFLGVFWVQEFDEYSVCILERGSDGLFQAKLKSDETIKTSLSAFIPEKFEGAE
jgi:hypothetical protein